MANIWTVAFGMYEVKKAEIQVERYTEKSITFKDIEIHATGGSPIISDDSTLIAINFGHYDTLDLDIAIRLDREV